MTKHACIFLLTNQKCANIKVFIFGLEKKKKKWINVGQVGRDARYFNQDSEEIRNDKMGCHACSQV